MCKMINHKLSRGRIWKYCLSVRGNFEEAMVRLHKLLGSIVQPLHTVRAANSPRHYVFEIFEHLVC